MLNGEESLPFSTFYVLGFCWCGVRSVYLCGLVCLFFYAVCSGACTLRFMKVSILILVELVLCVRKLIKFRFFELECAGMHDTRVQIVVFPLFLFLVWVY